MNARHLVRLAIVAGVLAAGCSTASMRAQTDLQRGRYDEAAHGFEQILARHPERVDAVVGLGEARYKRGDLEGAAVMLERAVVLAPGDVEARLYAALVRFRQSRDTDAEAHLAELVKLALHPRLLAHVQRTRDLLGAGTPLSDSLRAFTAAALEDAMAWDEEVRAARSLAHAALAASVSVGWDDFSSYPWAR